MNLILVDVDGHKEIPLAWAQWERITYDPKKTSELSSPDPIFNHKFIKAVDASARHMYEKHLTGIDFFSMASKSDEAEIKLY